MNIKRTQIKQAAWAKVDCQDSYELDWEQLCQGVYSLFYKTFNTLRQSEAHSSLLFGKGDSKLISLCVPQAHFNFGYECSPAQIISRHDLSVALEVEAVSPPASHKY